MFNGYNVKDLEISRVKGLTYKEALDNLEKAVKKEIEEGRKIIQPFGLGTKTIIPRPHTYEELARLIVESDPEPLDKILSTHNYTITSVAYPKEDNSQYKIIPVSKKLLTLHPEFNQPFVETDYKNVNGILIKKGKEKYNEPLTDKEYLEHPFFIETIPDENLRKEFRKKLKTYKSKTGEIPERFMGIYLLDNSEKTKDTEWAVCLNNYYSITNADVGLSSDAPFLLVSSRKKD